MNRAYVYLIFMLLDFEGEFLVRKDKIFTFIKPMCGGSFETGGDFELHDIFRLGYGLDFIDQFFPDAQTTHAFIDKHFLDFANFSIVVQQVLNVTTQKSDWLVFREGEQVNDFRIGSVF